MGHIARVMRVLMLYPSFPLSFWSIPEALRISGARSSYPPLGLLTVAALLPRDWPVRLVDLSVRRVDESDWSWADLVMLSGMLPQRERMLALVREAAGRGKMTVAGGPYATAVPEELREAGCRFVVRGEAEAAMPRLLDLISRDAPATTLESGGHPDLSLAPVPRYDLVDVRDYGAMAVQTSRGCPHDCEFCDIVSLFGRTPRHKAPSQVIAELDALRATGHRGEVFICDDNFIGVREKARGILGAVTEWNRVHREPFGFRTQAALGLGADLEMIDLLTAANFGEVCIGIESLDEEVLRLANKRQGLKYPAVESLTTVIRNGLMANASFILGLDGERPGADRRLCAAAEEACVPLAMPNLAAALPGTRLAARLAKEGRLRSMSSAVEAYMLGWMNFVPQRPEEDVRAEWRQAWDALYEPARYLARAYRAFLLMRPTRSATARARGEVYTGPATAPAPWRRTLWDLNAMLVLLWRQAVRAPYRGQFLRQLAAILRRNPSRVRQYLIACVLGEDLFLLRRRILQSVPAARSR
jgi:radical SAM superfamily enzyme YgiQ (UPF0313 family)